MKKIQSQNYVKISFKNNFIIANWQRFERTNLDSPLQTVAHVTVFLNSKLSATKLIGLFLIFKLITFIAAEDDRILPFHLRGLNGLIGVIATFFESIESMGPCTDKLYAVLPAGVEIMTPSDINFLITCLEPCLIAKVAACLL